MKKIFVMFFVCIMSLCAYASVYSFTPYCSGNDGVSYVQGQTGAENGSEYLKLYGYGAYQNATVRVIVYYKDQLGNTGERTTTITIVNGEGKGYMPVSLRWVTKIDIQVAQYCR